MVTADARDTSAAARPYVPRLPALLALRSQVADLREWPVDSSTSMRLLFYLGIGLGSCAGIETLLR